MEQSLSPIQREILEKVRLKKKQGLTTGQVARMLCGIMSQRTVIRLFDKGTLKGWRDPVTSRRMIDLKSVEALAKRQSLATGEASKMLGISVYRVVRLFDKGVLTGSKNPATGWRVIDRGSVEAFIRKHNVTTETQKEG